VYGPPASFASGTGIQKEVAVPFSAGATNQKPDGRLQNVARVLFSRKAGCGFFAPLAKIRGDASLAPTWRSFSEENDYAGNEHCEGLDLLPTLGMNA
jgi:hypothetical protein